MISIRNKIQNWKSKRVKKKLQAKVTNIFKELPIGDVILQKEGSNNTCACGAEFERTEVPEYNFCTALYCPKCRAAGMLINEKRLNAFLGIKISE